MRSSAKELIMRRQTLQPLVDLLHQMRTMIARLDDID